MGVLTWYLMPAFWLSISLPSPRYVVASKVEISFVVGGFRKTSLLVLKLKAYPDRMARVRPVMRRVSRLVEICSTVLTSAGLIVHVMPGCSTEVHGTG